MFKTIDKNQSMYWNKPTKKAEEDSAQQLGMLCENGKSSYIIVTQKNATTAERYSAEELKKYIYMATGAQLEIAEYNSGMAIGQRLISVGNTQLYLDCGTDVNVLKSQDGFIIKSFGNTIVINGKRDRGTVYGVYEFLERCVGIRFLTSSFEHIPYQQSVTLYQLDIAQSPVFDVRSYFAEAVKNNVSFASKMRMVAPNNPYGAESERVGGAFFEDWLTDLHSFNELLPYQRYGKTHSEWFSCKDEASQLVLSNGLNDDGTIDRSLKESVVLEVVKNIKQRLKQNKTVKYIMLGQNDNLNFSNNPNCVRQRKLFGGFSGQLVVFVNAVAREIEEWQRSEGITRELVFVTFAYKSGFKPPVKWNADGSVEAVSSLVYPRSNVYIMLAPYEASYNEPLESSEGEFNCVYYMDMLGWARLTDRLFMFDYSANFEDYLAWYPNTEVLEKNLALYQRLGVKGVFACGAILSGNYYQSNLNTYLCSKMMWGANLDELIAEFNRLCFGERAGKIIDRLVAYFRTRFKNEADKDGYHKPSQIFTIASPWLTSAETLSYNFVTEAGRLVESARWCIQNNNELTEKQRADYLSNVLTVDIMVEYMKYLNYDKLFLTTHKEKQQFLQQFYSKLQMAGITKFYEGRVTIKEVFDKVLK